MASFLRRSAYLARIPSQSLTAASRPSYTPSRSALSNSSLCVHQRARSYATGKPGPRSPNDKKKRVGGQDGKESDASKKPEEAKAPAPPGSEDANIKTSKQPNESTDSQTLTSQLSKEELEAFDKAIYHLKSGMPAGMRKDLDKTIDLLKNEPMSPEVKQLVNELRSREHMDLGTTMRLLRVMKNRELDQARKDRATSETDQPEQKASHDPGPKDQRQKDRKRGQIPDSDPLKGIRSIKLDGQLLAGIIAGWILWNALMPSENAKEITWQELRTSFLEKGLVQKIEVSNSKRARVFLHPDAGVDASTAYYFSIGSVDSFERQLKEAQDDLGIPGHDHIPVAYVDSVSWVSALFSFGPTLLLMGLLLLPLRSLRGGMGGSNGVFGMMKSRAKKFNHETDVKVSFHDVAGMDEAKQEIMEFVSFLREPGMYQKLGAKIPRGAILSGPPGTGKTLLAKATAGESSVPFFSVSGSEFVEMFVGVGASRVRDLFTEARKNTPCIIFIDEIDAIGKSRGKQNFGGNDEREATLNQILTEMDGFNTNEQVVVLAGTNRPDVLDKALMRPGRFDRHISIDAPTMQGRKQIFGVHLKKIVTNEDMDQLQGRLSHLTPGFSGADIANCVNEAALIAAREKATSVTLAHFEKAIERVIGGLEKKSMVLSAEDKKVVAYHEAGHAICGWYFKYADPLLKVSIIPRGSAALGYAQYLPQGDTYLMNVNQLMDRMAMTLGGRVSEELHFDTVTSGASDDFNKVTRMATAMVTKWGMSRKIGYLYFEDDSQQQLHKPFSEETARNIDSEVRRIVEEAYKQCRDLLTEKQAEVAKVAEELLKKEMLSRDDMVRLLGKRPFDDKAEFAKYFGGNQDDESHGTGPIVPQDGDKPPPQPEGPTPPPAGAPAAFKRHWV